MKAIVLATMTYGCELWTLNAQSEKRINAFEMKCYRKILRIPYTAHGTNENVKDEIVHQCGNQETLLSIVKRRKIQWFGYVRRNDNSLSLANIMHGRVPGKRGRGRPRKAWLSNILMDKSIYDRSYNKSSRQKNVERHWSKQDSAPTAQWLRTLMMTISKSILLLN